MYIFKQLQCYTSTCSTQILIKMVNDNSYHDDVTADVKYHVWLTFLCVFSDGTNVEIFILITVKGTWFLQKYIKIQLLDMERVILWWYTSDYSIIKLKIIAEGYNTIF